jgi:hypothetical protein
VQSDADQLEIKIKDWLIANDKAGNTQSSSTTRGLMVHLMSPGSSPSRIDHPIGVARRVRTTQVPTRENPPTEARTLTTQVVRALEVYTGPTRSSQVATEKEV